MDLITNTINPCLPSCLSIGISHTISRLKEKGFFITKRHKINRAGNVNMLIFDETGLLDEDNLDIKGFICTKINKSKQFEFNLIDDFQNVSKIILEHFNQKNKYKNWNKDLLQNYIECLACCQSLTSLDGKILGDPKDIKIFQSIGWILKENNINQENNNNYNPLILNYI